jgi:predicted kinase
VAVIPGARNPQAVREVAAATRLVLDDGERDALAGEFPALRDRVVVAAAPGDGEVVLVMGLPGAGKSAAAQSIAAGGYERLNRDQLGGSLAELAARLDERLASGVRRLVLDNTYLTRSARAQVLAVAARQGVAVRGVFIDVSLTDAQVNVVERMLAAHGRLLTPEELRRADDNTALAPSSLWRMERSLERPNADEGFTSLDVRQFTRLAKQGPERSARFVALELLDRLSPDDARSSFAIGWAPNAAPDLEAQLGVRVQGVAVCRHPGGPPICWCRPPLPGQVLWLARAYALDVTASELHGTSRAHRSLAVAVGARYIHHG